MSERPVVGDAEDDNRNVIEAFPSPPTVADQSESDAILEVLRRSHDRIETEARRAADAAAMATSEARALTARVEQNERAIDEARRAVGTEDQGARQAEFQAQRKALLGEVSAILSSDTRKLRAAGIASGLGSFGAHLATAIRFIPAFVVLAAAIWLWKDILADPKPLQLVALGLFGVVVIGPAIALGGCFGKGKRDDR